MEESCEKLLAHGGQMGKTAGSKPTSAGSSGESSWDDGERSFGGWFVAVKRG
jgi:hypothetical protein